tara:strand:+ start:788 stop:1846 length:1059 start_codon:yes stop_codon:yes gene_type:complete
MGLVNAAKQIESYGRGPDTSLAHISPDESAMLDYMQGGRRMNPVTGLPEYSLFGKILKSVAKIGASTVGFMYGGPLGAAAASAAVSKLTGDSWKSALTTGAISGVTSGIGNVASGGFKNALSSGLNQGSGLGGLGFSKAASFTNDASSKFLNSAAMNPGGIAGFAKAIPTAGYGALGAGLGAAIPNKGTPATAPPPAWATLTYDPNNIFSWLKKPSQQQQIAVSPMNTYQNYAPEMQTYADGGDVGMGLPQSASMPQLMSAAQFGYLNARTGGMIAGPGDGKSDDIPAMLSNGEHVIDAATVSDLGNGDNDTGHKRIEEIKHKIRSSAGRKNPRKASPKQKGLGSLLKSARA